MGVDLEIVIALVTSATAAGAAVATRIAPRHSRPPPPPPPAVCAPEVAAQVDELHGLLARRDPVTGGSVVLTHLSELPRIRELLEVIAQGRPSAAGAAE